MAINRWNWIYDLFSERYKGQLLMSIFFIHLLTFPVCVSNVFADTSGIFPATPYTGMQIEYNIEGVELDAPVDTLRHQNPYNEEMRSYTGTFIPGSTLTLSGLGHFQATVYDNGQWGNGYFNTGSMRVSISSGSDTEEYYFKSPSEYFSEPYNIQMELPDDGKAVDFRITLYTLISYLYMHDPVCDRV